jgi:hypothetical protein
VLRTLSMGGKETIMRLRLALVPAVLLPVVLMLLTSPAALAHGRCIVSGTARQTTGRFEPTILDMWAFPVVLPAPAPVPVVSPVVLCPSVVVIVPTLVSPLVFPGSPLFVDPQMPIQPAPNSSPAGGSPQPPVQILATGAAPPPVTVADLARTPTAYDRQAISVSGTIAAYAERFTDHDVRYAEFRLEAGGASIPVVAWGHLRLEPGLRVRVTGTFHDVAPFVLSGGDRPRGVLVSQVVTQASGSAQAP